MSPPFHAEKIGSLMRPAELLAVRSAAGTSTYSALTETELQKAIGDAITNEVEKQLKLGIRPITSGEYERDKFFSGFFEHLEGMEVVKDIPLDQGYRTNFSTLRTLRSLDINSRDSVVTTGRIRHTHSAYLSEWEALRRLLPEDKWKECKLTMPPVTHFHMQVSSRSRIGCFSLTNLATDGCRKCV
jgi:methionine synthase II (cobalamin-independent)